MRAHSLGVIFSPLWMYTETKDSVLVICVFFFFFALYLQSLAIGRKEIINPELVLGSQ